MSSKEPESPLPFHGFAQDNSTMLGQALQFVERLEPTAFGQPHPDLGLSSIGSHLRHILDFYTRFFEATDAWLAGDREPLLDYDRRERKPKLEVDPKRAAEAIQATLERLRDLPKDLAGETVLVKTDCVDADPDVSARSTFDRELQALMSHTVHHYALIKIAAGRVQVDPGRSFGVAPSTLRYWERSGACAP